MQELEKRMMQIYNLSNNWEDCKNDEDLVIKNTYNNSKTAMLEGNQGKQAPNKNKRNITWG